jgi:hypothetical protein
LKKKQEAYREMILAKFKLTYVVHAPFFKVTVPA